MLNTYLNSQSLSTVVALCLTTALCLTPSGCADAQQSVATSDGAEHVPAANVDESKEEIVEDAKQSASEEPGETRATSARAADPSTEGTVLRHTVFFKFKDETSEQKIQEIVDAFRALPEKISAIKDFEWGVNNSPENLNEGFTHCFVLTFADEAGRDEYLPHPAHKEFGKVLSGHNEKVFVIDYLTTPPENLPEKRLRHMVFFRFRKDAEPEDIKRVEEAFAALPSRIPEIKGFEWGVNNSPERHSDGFTHCFTVTFDSEEGRAAYLPHPEHRAFVEVLKPVLDAARVLDFFAQE